jgi:hypothetical protein
VYGAEFFWPMLSANPHLEQIESGIDIVKAHGPAEDMLTTTEVVPNSSNGLKRCSRGSL